MKLASYAHAVLKDEAGPTAVEYAVMLALVLMGVIAAINSVGTSTSAMMQDNTDRITSAVNSVGS
ncbi:Flp family type IVb pilin [Singulisphaera sp. Ch08]|uniref:Flp family type IVb pilin n=1 Tax=Singulisphaera sp. Ch08 TaxID=3120278 RepID=A0AAU7CEU9_9BACT